MEKNGTLILKNGKEQNVPNGKERGAQPCLAVADWSAKDLTKKSTEYLLGGGGGLIGDVMRVGIFPFTGRVSSLGQLFTSILCKLFSFILHKLKPLILRELFPFILRNCRLSASAFYSFDISTPFQIQSLQDRANFLVIF